MLMELYDNQFVSRLIVGQIGISQSVLIKVHKDLNSQLKFNVQLPEVRCIHKYQYINLTFITLWTVCYSLVGTSLYHCNTQSVSHSCVILIMMAQRCLNHTRWQLKSEHYFVCIGRPRYCRQPSCCCCCWPEPSLPGAYNPCYCC